MSTLLAADYCSVAFDAIHANVFNIPLDAFAVGGYINGAVTEFHWTNADWSRFPNAYHIRINVTGDPTRGNCLDVENGDATPPNVQPWIEHKGGCPNDPLIVYCNRSNFAAVSAARDAARDATGIFAWIWEATLDGTLTTSAMTQIGQVRNQNGAVVLDMSLISDVKLRDEMALRIGHQ